MVDKTYESRPQGITSDGVEIWCAVAKTEWGTIPCKYQNGICIYEHGGKEHEAKDFTVIKSQMVTREPRGKPHGKVQNRDLWCVVVNTQWGKIPGKAFKDMCWYTYEGKVHFTKEFVYVYGDVDTIDPVNKDKHKF